MDSFAMPTVSVIVPNYNHAPFLRQRFDSIFNQTFQDIEVIILDDCSTDNSKEIIEEYRNKPQTSHIVYNKANSGSPFKQWAKGFDLAQGEYIWIAESDDWAELNFLEATLPILESKKNLSLIFSASKVVSRKSKIEISPFSTSTEMLGLEFIKKRMIIDNAIPNASAVLFRRDRLFSISKNYQNFRGAGDYLFWIYLCELGDVFFLAKPLNFFRLHQNNTTQKCRNDGTVCKEAYTINNYLLQKGYISYWEKNLLILKNVERINELDRTASFSKEVNVKKLINLWKKNNSFVFFKIKLIRLFALIQKISFKLKIIKEPQSLIFTFFKNDPIIALIWKMFNLPSFGLRYILQACSYIKRPLNLFDNWAALGRLNWMPDKWYLSLMFRSHMGYWMDWKHPKTFNEKLQWLKIHNRNPLYTKLVDKYEARKYIAEKIGEEYLIPLLGVWNSPNEIDFDKLPDQFVLKCTHDSGSVIICKNKRTFDFAGAKKKIAANLSKNFYYMAREWPYKNVKPRIIAEKYMEDPSGELRDFKFFCFNGNVNFLQVDYERFINHHRCIFDANWNIQPFSIIYPPKDDIKINKPLNLNKMLDIASKISKEILPFIRVDFYECNEKLFIGELTFYPEAGFAKFAPDSWDQTTGSLLAI